MVIVHSCVSLPEGNFITALVQEHLAVLRAKLRQSLAEHLVRQADPSRFLLN